MRLFFLTALAGVALIAEQHRWGLFHQFQLPSLLKIIFSVLILDFVIYLQHVMFHVVASLPSIFEGITDGRRGGGVFHSSIKILKKLNEMGYGTDGLQLDLVYNPANADLPPEQNQWEEEYKELLKNHYGIIFSHLILLVNCPVTRFKDFLARQGRYHQYMDLLKKNYNPKTLDLMMCRNLISVDDKGHVYDCDFNLAVGMRIKGYENKKLWEIDFDRFEPEIALGEHCYACTVNQGSH